MITVKEDKKNRVTFHIVEMLDRNTDVALSMAHKEIGQDTRREIRRLIRTGPKTGITYGSHHASAPDESPAEDTGNLSRSVGYRTRGAIQVTVGDRAPYGVHLEFGTKNMAPRPHVERAVMNKAKDTRMSYIKHTNRMVLSK